LERKNLLGVLFLILSIAAVSVSAYVYEQAQLQVTQTIKEIATLTVQNSALGNIEEGETKSITKATVSSLGNILNITTTKANVYLHFNSNLETLAPYYTTYTITVKFATVPGGSHNAGDIACTMTLGAPDPATITLDASGAWRFDFEITTTAKSVSSDQPTTATIVVTAEST
jgi:hypothetical protein